MSTLYIIGNGFDLFHGLATTTTDFCELLSSKDVYGDYDNAKEVLLNYGVDWSEYESSLGLMDLQAIEEENLSFPDYLSDHEYDREGTIWYMNEHLQSLAIAVEESLKEMVENANNMLYDIDPKMIDFLEGGDAVLTFNYTSTLERLYHIDNIPIFHIHGCYSHNEPLTFGYKDLGNAEKYRNGYLNPADDRDYYVDSQRECILGFYERWKKQPVLKELSCFLASIGKIDRVCVMGHSMASVDSDYMELIERSLCPKEWFVSQYSNSPNIEELRNYSFVNKIHFFSLNDYAM